MEGVFGDAEGGVRSTGVLCDGVFPLNWSPHMCRLLLSYGRFWGHDAILCRGRIPEPESDWLFASDRRGYLRTGEILDWTMSMTAADTRW